MFNLRPEDLFPWLRVEPPPADEVPGFNLNPDGSAGDTQRSATNVGLFDQQAGLTLGQVLANAGTFASWKSSNAKSQEPYGLDPQTREFIELGCKIGERGVFGRAEAP